MSVSSLAGSGCWLLGCALWLPSLSEFAPDKNGVEQVSRPQLSSVELDGLQRVEVRFGPHTLAECRRAQLLRQRVAPHGGAVRST